MHLSDLTAAANPIARELKVATNNTFRRGTKGILVDSDKLFV